MYRKGFHTLEIIIILSAWLLADFISGIVHWWQDRYLTTNRKWKWVLAINADNDEHHKSPGAMAKKSTWQTINTTAPILWPLAILSLLLGGPAVITLGLFFGGFANLIHKWAHTADSKLNPVIRFMQDTGLFISKRHHGAHHYNRGRTIRKENTHDKYCPMSDFLNPFLDTIRFWKGLEYVVSLVGIHPTKRTQ